MLDIRPARPDDLPVLEALLARASIATGEIVQALLDHPGALRIPEDHIAHTLVGVRDERVLGFCTVIPLSPDRAEVEAIFVDPAHWRRGLGEALLSAAELKLAREGVAALEVVSGAYAVPFYKALGFNRSGTETTRFGPAVRLAKTLP